MRVLDSHLHLITATMYRRMEDRFPGIRRAALKDVHSRASERLRQLEGLTLEDHARMWLTAFDQAGVEAGAFIAVGEANEELARFVAINPRRLLGWGSLSDPRHPDAPKILEEFPAMGLIGLKLYPPIQRFLPNDRALYPIYEKAAELGLPILFHFGITVAAFYDLTYANPLPLSAPVKEFPEVTFIIAHFGAGFFRETLFLAYHTENVYVDTSGTNNWREYHPGNPSLEEVFRDTLRAFGPSRILFGTDSTFFGGYRQHILAEQVEILRRLDLSEEDRQLILGGNARRLFRPKSVS